MSASSSVSAPSSQPRATSIHDASSSSMRSKRASVVDGGLAAAEQRALQRAHGPRYRTGVRLCNAGPARLLNRRVSPRWSRRRGTRTLGEPRPRPRGRLLLVVDPVRPVAPLRDGSVVRLAGSMHRRLFGHERGYAPGGPDQSVGLGGARVLGPTCLSSQRFIGAGVAPRLDDAVERALRVQPARARRTSLPDVHALHAQQLDARVIVRVPARRALAAIARVDARSAACAAPATAVASFGPDCARRRPRRGSARADRASRW